ESWFPSAKSVTPAAAVAPTVSVSATQLASKNDRRPLVFAPAGNWFRDDGSFSSRYRPAAHADPVLATWLSVLAQTPDLSQRPVAAAMFKELTKPNSPGLCTSCHSVERNTQNQLAINWRAYDRTAELRGFTKFSHGPPRLLPQLADCTHCHAIDGKASSTTAYAGLYPERFVGDFAPISKRQCTE